MTPETALAIVRQYQWRISDETYDVGKDAQTRRKLADFIEAQTAIIATLTAERDQLLEDIKERDRTYLAVQKVWEVERDALRTALEAADNIFRAVTDGWGALQAIGPTHEQLAAYVSASRALGGKS